MPAYKPRPWAGLLLAVCAWSLPVAGAVGQETKHDKPPRPYLVPQVGHASYVVSVAFTSDGKRLVTGSTDKTARLWDVETGKEIRAFRGHEEDVTTVALSADGKYLVTGSGDNTACLWDLATGKRIRAFQGHTKGVCSVVLSSGNRYLATASGDKTARLWDLNTGKQLRSFEGHYGLVSSVALSADGKTLITGNMDWRVRLWDVETGKERRFFRWETEQITSMALSTDGKYLVTGTLDKTARLWDLLTGKSIRAFQHGEYVFSVALSNDSKHLLTGCDDKMARLWDVETGKQIRAFRGHTDSVISVAISADGKCAATGSRDTTARLWDVATGKEICTLRGRARPSTAAALSADNKSLVLFAGYGTGRWWKDKAARVWDLVAGRQTRVFLHTESITSAALYGEGKYLATAGLETVRLWTIATGKELRVLADSEKITSMALTADGKTLITADRWHATLWDPTTGKKIRKFVPDYTEIVTLSPDGRTLATGSINSQLWDVTTGEQIHEFKSREVIFARAFSSDGKYLITAGSDHLVRLWDLATRKEIRVFRRHSDWILAVALSEDGKHLVTASLDGVRLWEVSTGKEVRNFRGHDLFVTSVLLSADGKYLLTAGADNTARFWDLNSGKELCQLISFWDDSWAVVDSYGRYDASNGGDIDGLHWVIGNEIVGLAQLKGRYFDPGLLAKYLGYIKEPLRSVEAFEAPKLFPDVTVGQPSVDNPKLAIALTNRGGGIGRVVIRVNGRELTADARGPKDDPDAKALELKVDLPPDHPLLIPGKKNVIEVYAYNNENYLRSRGLQVLYDVPDRPKSVTQLWAVVGGVSDYSGDKIDLRYAAKDAEDFAKALKTGGTRLFGAEKVQTTLLTTAQPGNSWPTRTLILKALEAAQKLKSTDIFVLYLAGHGVTHGGQDGDYYFLCSDAQTTDLTDPAVRAQVAISSQELTEYLKKIPALKQVLILDTCSAGKAVDKMIDKRHVPASQVRALDRLRDRTGVYVLAGCASDSASYEATQYAQGVLTYSLLMGMRGAALREEQFVDVATLFNFAADKVPELARDIGGIQRPVLAGPKGASFDIGQVTADDKAAIPLQQARPLMLRTLFQEEESFDDILGLAAKTDERFRSLSVRGPQTPLVFVDAREFPDAFRLAGRYRIKDGEITVTLNVFRGITKVDTFTVQGRRNQLDNLVTMISDEIEKRLAKTKLP